MLQDLNNANPITVPDGWDITEVIDTTTLDQWLFNANHDGALASMHRRWAHGDNEWVLRGHANNRRLYYYCATQPHTCFVEAND